jgi:hypothetical protein
MADKDEAKVEVPAGPLGADAQSGPPESKADLKEILVNPADYKLHPPLGDASLEAERGAQKDPDRPPFASSGPAELLTGLAGGPGESHQPDPDKFDAEGRPK